jgi:hypothetical protein
LQGPNWFDNDTAAFLAHVHLLIQPHMRGLQYLSGNPYGRTTTPFLHDALHTMA